MWLPEAFSLFLLFFFLIYCGLSYSAPIAAVALLKIRRTDSFFHICSSAVNNQSVTISLTFWYGFPVGKVCIWYHLQGGLTFPLMEEGRYINSLSLSTSPLHLKTELQLNLNSLAWGQVKWVINTDSGSWAWIHMSIDYAMCLVYRIGEARLKHFLSKHCFWSSICTVPAAWQHTIWCTM